MLDKYLMDHSKGKKDREKRNAEEREREREN